MGKRMTLLLAQTDLNARFTYRRDTGESWRVLTGGGPVEGDCEDYSLTLIWLAEGRSWVGFWRALISFKYVIWFCHAPNGEGHAVLWCRGQGWTDNIQRRIVARLPEGYRLRVPYLVPQVALKFLLRPLLRRS